MASKARQSKRTLPGNAAVLQCHRLAKGWSVDQLAHEAGLSQKTIERLENGEEAYITTWMAVAKALNMGMDTLLPFPDLLPTAMRAAITPKPESTQKCTITAKVDIPTEALDKATALVKWLSELAAAIGATASIDVIDHFKGSTYIRLLMDVADFQSMCQRFLSGELTENHPDLRIEAIFAGDLLDPDAYGTSCRRSLPTDVDDDTVARRRPNQGRHKREQ